MWIHLPIFPSHSRKKKNLINRRLYRFILRLYSVFVCDSTRLLCDSTRLLYTFFFLSSVTWPTFIIAYSQGLFVNTTCHIIFLNRAMKCQKITHKHTYKRLNTRWKCTHFIYLANWLTIFTPQLISFIYSSSYGLLLFFFSFYFVNFQHFSTFFRLFYPNVLLCCFALNSPSFIPKSSSFVFYTSVLESLVTYTLNDVHYILWSSSSRHQKQGSD